MWTIKTTFSLLTLASVLLFTPLGTKSVQGKVQAEKSPDSNNNNYPQCKAPDQIARMEINLKDSCMPTITKPLIDQNLLSSLRQPRRLAYRYQSQRITCMGIKAVYRSIKIQEGRKECPWTTVWWINMLIQSYK